MSSYPAPYRPAGLRTRLAAWAAATTVTSSILAALLLSFHGSAPDTWLAPSPGLLQMAAKCDRHSGRAARDRCKQDVVSARLAVERNAGQLARR